MRGNDTDKLPPHKALALLFTLNLALWMAGYVLVQGVLTLVRWLLF